MKKFPSLPKNLKKLLTDYQSYLHNQQTSQIQHVNPTSNIHSSSNQISYQQSTTNNTQTNPTSIINPLIQTNKQIQFNSLTPSITNKQSIPSNQSNCKPLSFADLTSNNTPTPSSNNLNNLSNHSFNQISPHHLSNQHSFQNISSIHPSQSISPSPLELSVNHQLNSFDQIDNISTSTLTSFNSSQLSSMQIDQSQSTNNNTILPQHLSSNTDSFDKFQQELNKEFKQLDTQINNISPPQSNNTISTNHQPTSSSNNINTLPTTNDIRNITLEQDNQSTQYLSKNSSPKFMTLNPSSILLLKSKNPI